METFIKNNIGILAFYLILIGGILLINIRFSNPVDNHNNIVALNK